MFVNDVLSRVLGVRLVRESALKASGLYARRDASQAINEKFRKGLGVIEKFCGKSLTPGMRRQADDYARVVLGSLDYAPSLHFYAAMQGRFREGWMPENFYHLVVVPEIMKGFFEISAKKSLSNRLMRTEALPDIAYHIGGLFYDRDYRPISRAQMIDLARPHGAVFVKGDDSGRGESVCKVPVAALAGHEFRGNGVIQKPIRQHPFFDEFVTGPVATLRITTARGTDGVITERGAYLRLGRAGGAWVRSDNSLRVAVIDRHGGLDAQGYTGDWRPWAAHPDTNAPFKNRRIPEYGKAVELCLSLHSKVPHPVTVGWDVAVNHEGGIELLEWNGGHGDIKFCEAICGPYYRDMGWERFARKAQG